MPANAAEIVHSRLSSVLAALVGLSLLTILSLAFLQVVLRYAFAASILWVEEVSVMGLGWMAWLGATQLWLQRQHISVDILPARHGVMRATLSRLADLLAVAFGVALFMVATTTIDAFAGIEMGSLEIDAGVKYYPLIGGGSGLALAGALNLWRAVAARPA